MRRNKRFQLKGCPTPMPASPSYLASSFWKIMRRLLVRVLFLSSFPTLVLSAQQAAPVAPTGGRPVLIPHAQAPTATAATRSGTVNIDGRLDEAAWQAADRKSTRLNSSHSQ